MQALRQHAFAPLTAEPGEADLTSHVDFQSLGAALAQAGAMVLPAMEQGRFLRAMGLEARTEALARGAVPPAAGQLRNAAARLADDRQMGKLFKVLCAASPGTAALFPFGAR